MKITLGEPSLRSLTPNWKATVKESDASSLRLLWSKLRTPETDVFGSAHSAQLRVSLSRNCFPGCPQESQFEVNACCCEITSVSGPL